MASSLQSTQVPHPERHFPWPLAVEIGEALLRQQWSRQEHAVAAAVDLGLRGHHDVEQQVGMTVDQTRQQRGAAEGAVSRAAAYAYESTLHFTRHRYATRHRLDLAFSCGATY